MTKSKNILVFGAAGFVGTYLIDELLERNCAVFATDMHEDSLKYYKDKGVDYTRVDITKKNDFERLKRERYDAVIHLAACQPANIEKGRYDPREYIEVNVVGTLNILDFCRENKADKIIYATSHRNTQALWGGGRSIREQDGRGMKYDGEYAMFSISESAAQDCVLHYQAQHGLRGIILRLPPVYGFGPHTEIFKEGKQVKTGFQIFIERAMASQPLEIWGDADLGRDIIYIKDVVSAFILATDSRTATGLYNISSGKSLTLREQARAIADSFWGSETSPQIVERPEKPNDIEPFLYDISKANKELGWSPKYSFQDMLTDYKKEIKKQRYEHLVEKRQGMFQKK